MKVQLETISPDSKSPFRLLHDPKLSHLFYWHFHPELELVYIEGADAKRHVGDHISNFEGSDLVLIGSNIPHLNFDHGVTTPYRKEVLHIKPSFKDNVLRDYPELKQLDRLLDLSRYGVAFHGKTKEEVGTLLKKLYQLEPFEFFISVLNILKRLSQSKEFQLLHKTPYVNKLKNKEQKRMRKIYSHIDERYQEKLTLDEMANLCGLTKPAFCRYFKKTTGSTFVSFLNQYRISQAKRLLLMGKNVGEACFECGFESLSYFNRSFKKVTGENPSVFKKGFTSH
ncbi:AraC family transcriptional regulator [Maribacter sp. PR1]|uniref:AraC family transcriptional regulator n=1 Tax=Maribacter cobaltidurans TaxID=1178778 RepID=A0ABU7ISE7_9FLAO|nr:MULTISPECIES: AraC family transcriptional regulator [Maribacter]MDC6388063.1 AraC family transcriptional regulator [Maribacter sp. PR1]MEE1975451.1 AraC family transcriptional regulator [Maribacter cobaltidurans]